MKILQKRDTVYTGFLLFSLFFGAGSLIFPPMLGQEAGSAFFPATIGFVLTCVGLPLLGIIAIAVNKGSVEIITSKIHPKFTILFMVVLYLAIGPFFAIPRAMNVSYEMGLAPFLDGQTALSLLLYSGVFILICYLFVVIPSKLIEGVGKWVTPLLFLTIAFLVVGYIGLNISFPTAEPIEKYAAMPFFKGFVDGYLMMDAIASLAFGTFVIALFKERGITDERQLLKGTVYAGSISAICLAIVYFVIAYIGVLAAKEQTFTNGAELLSYAANAAFGAPGAVLLGAVVTLACLTTCIGLIAACGQYFHATFPKISYRTAIVSTIVISFCVSNFGLNNIISISLPVLYIIYPITFLIIAFSFLHKVLPFRRGTYIGAFLGAFIVCLYDGLAVTGLPIGPLKGIFSYLPFIDIQMGWLLPALLGGVIGHFLPITETDERKSNIKIPSVKESM